MKKEERQLRIGVLGCGPISQFAHFESVQKARNASLFAVCDVDEGLARHFGQFYNAQNVYLDYDQMLADPEVEAVIIGTSDAFHVPASLKALAAGKHVLCEKPIGVSVEEVEQLAREVPRSGNVLQIGHMLRFDPGIESAKAFVQDEMGEMLALKAWYCDSTHRYTNTDAIQPQPRQGSRVLRPQGDPKADRQRYYMLAHGSHLVDLARYLGGPIRAVDARLREKFGAYCWFVDVDFENGTLGHLDLTIAVRMDWHEGFQVYGEHGSATAKIYNPWYYKSSDVDIFHERNATTTRVLGADGHFYRRQLEGFADTALKGVAMRGADIVDGVASIRAMVAIAQSVRSGKPVALADVGDAL
ncbi:Myo-inositol 2-dehydrogenase [Paraburkholderia caribensis MBA4]|uniref:Myo-inositol 2-dehydrogenase n=1 Tax=Paraburkholderia caribensis MBA4 TaxID=1323664 RepID=A0A0P0RIK2_9BURK|nr:Gfo/Idh/MocA family oxidoreductase [Paraburkholderia caribensis]ALL68499.1 Myo-inositol 2-dehydrogenase [Paraburkholderia caribensis MBA4]